MSNYSENINISSLEGPKIDEAIYFDQTKFFGDNALINPNPIPNNPNLDSLYHYYNEINNIVPSYYFIWNRTKYDYQFDPDTDPSLNQYPYDLYYRLELINDLSQYL